ncbi:hypothetical protein J1605_014342 [Eschrichtius robustus]|uniref:Uncharacterized protein n=1 Tax=Eschrichtius robustus TaxID=9764 RepID=A0AB34GDA7_ESCRO|nr:hypothetical protein J1605_014342 [Eschrichtius robustus]
MLTSLCPWPSQKARAVYVGASVYMPGYMTDGGLGLYTRRLNRLPDGMAVVRETLQRNTSLGLGDADSSAGPGDLLGFLC